MVVFLLHTKIRDAFRRINPDLRISAARFDYEVVFSLLFPQKKRAAFLQLDLRRNATRCELILSNCFEHFKCFLRHGLQIFI